MIPYIDSLAVNINDISTLSTDGIYFDFAKAFDSVKATGGGLTLFCRFYIC